MQSPTVAHRPSLLPAVILGAILIAAATAAIIWEAGFKERFFPRDFGVVEPGLIYRSGQISPQLIEKILRDNRIGLIVFLSGDNTARADVNAERDAAARLHIARLNFPLAGDGTGSIIAYADAIAAVADAVTHKTPVLVHCATGAQRTGGLVAFWRVLVRNQSPQAAYRELLTYRHDPQTNPRLLPYINGNMARLAQLLLDRHVIPKIPSPIPIIAP